MNDLKLAIILENGNISSIFANANHDLIINNPDAFENLTCPEEKTQKLKELWEEIYRVDLITAKNHKFLWSEMQFQDQITMTAFALRWG